MTYQLFVYILTADFSYLFTFRQLISFICLHFDSCFQLFVYILTIDFSYLFKWQLISTICLHFDSWFQLFVYILTANLVLALMTKCCFQSCFCSFGLIFVSFIFAAPCRFRGERAGEKTVRLSEATPVGTEAFRILAFPRRNFNIQALDGVICNIIFASLSYTTELRAKSLSYLCFFQESISFLASCIFLG